MPLEPDLIDWKYEAPKPMGDTYMAAALKTMFNYNYQPSHALSMDLQQWKTVPSGPPD